jgi:hypothetical protein
MKTSRRYPGPPKRPSCESCKAAALLLLYCCFAEDISAISGSAGKVLLAALLSSKATVKQ